MSFASTIMYEFKHLEDKERKYDALSDYWKNDPIVGSWAYGRGQRDDRDPEVRRKKRALRKAWPELAKMLDGLAEEK